MIPSIMDNNICIHMIPHVSTASPWQMWMLLIAAYLVPDTVDEDGEAKLWNSLKQISKLFQMVANIWRFFHMFPTVLVWKCQGLPKTLRTVLYLDVLHLDQQVPGFAAAFLELLGPKKMRHVTASEMWVRCIVMWVMCVLVLLHLSSFLNNVGLSENRVYIPNEIAI